MKTRRLPLTTLDLTLIPLFTVLTILGATIRIPLGTVPVSLQSVFVLLSGLLLGKKGALSQGLYVLLGLLGLPVFTGGGGLLYIFTPTFGYLLGFIMASYLVGSFMEKRPTKSLPFLLLYAFLGLLTIYGFGVTYLYVLMGVYFATPLPFIKALQVGALIFLPMDLVWVSLGAVLTKRLQTLPLFSRRLHTFEKV